MKESHPAIAVAALVMVASLFTFIGMATDQPPTPITPISMPANMEFYGVAWNEANYNYAIAVGENTSSGEGVIFKFDPEHGWIKLYEEKYGTIFYDVAYDSLSSNGTFIVVGDNGGESDAYILYDVDGTMRMVGMGDPPPGNGYTAVYFDPTVGDGRVIAVGSMYTDTQGIIAWHDMDANPASWESLRTPKGVIITDVTTNQDPEKPLAIAVGCDPNNQTAVAYACNYHEVYGLNVPPDAKEFRGIDWVPGDPNGYAVVVGDDTDGKARMWKMFDLSPRIHISYYNGTSGHESLKYAFYNGHTWHFSTINPSQYAGYYTSIALDYRGRPHISYWNGGDTHLYHEWYNGSSWNIDEVDNGNNVGQFSSIAIDDRGHIHVSYYDSTNKALKYAYYDGNSWSVETVDSSAGEYSSIAVYSDGYGSVHVQISYYDSTNGDLKYAYKDSNGWHTEVVDSTNDVGKYSSLAVDSLGNPHISYADTTHGGLKYAYKIEGSWHTEYAVQGSQQCAYISLYLDRDGNPHISYISSGLKYIENVGGTWSTPVSIDSNAQSWNSMDSGPDGTPIISYYGGASQDLMLAYLNESGWQTVRLDSNGNVGDYSSIAVGIGVSYLPIKIDNKHGSLCGVSWSPDGNLAIAVGSNGEVFVHYRGTGYAYNWTDPSFTSQLGKVAVKTPGSPGYGLAVGPASSAKISYQTYNTNTAVTTDVVKPHLNEVNMTDEYGNCVLNHQLDVDKKYTFFINASYQNGWDKIGGMDIYAWYDFGDESRQYNDTQGGNLNFHLHYTPDTNGNYLNGRWSLEWPKNGEVTLIDWYTTYESNGGGGGGTPLSTDYFLLYVNISLGPQVRYANGTDKTTGIGFPPNPGPAQNQSNPSQAFNNPHSWNFNVTLYDKNNPSTNDVKYDEFGVYAYTEIIASGNPTGVGSPGSYIYLSPDSHLVVRANRNYSVTVSIDDLVDSQGTHIIGRSNVSVYNSDAGGDSSISGISQWERFPSNGGPLYVWGTSTHHMWALNDGTCSVGMNPGYNPDTDYTIIQWEITIPPATPEGTYTSVISFEITY